MIPIRDSIPVKNTPYVNYLLIALNVIIFIVEIFLGSRTNSLISMYALTPEKFFSMSSVSIQKVTPVFSSMFLHGSLVHLGTNMLFLYIFGDNVEDKMGHFRYLFFYILIGALSSLAHVYANPASAVPSLGASGAISGILGAYIYMYPKAKIYTLVFMIFFITIVEIPAFIFIGIWFLIQIASTISISSHTVQAGGIAYFAHIGGFISGIILIIFFRRRSLEGYVDYY